MHADQTNPTPDQGQAVSELKRKAVRGVASFFFRTLVLQGIGFASAVLLSAYLNPEDFGVFGIVTQLTGLLIFFSDIGVAAALVQAKDTPSLTDYRTAFTLQQLLAWLIVGVSVFLVLFGLIEPKVGSAGVWVFLALAISFPLAALKTIPSILLERELRFDKLITPQIAEQLVFHITLIILAMNGLGVLSYAYAVIFRSIIGVIVMYGIKRWEVGLSWNKASLNKLLKFGFQFQLIDLLARIKDQLYFLVLGMYLPLKEFGYIQWAKNWSLYPYQLTVQNVMAITFPTFARLQDNPKLLQRAIEKSIYFIALSIFPVLIYMIVGVSPLIHLISKYEKWIPAITSFVLFTASIFGAALSSPITNALNALGKISWSVRLMTMWTVLTWVLTPICLKFMGYNGVSVAAILLASTSFIPILLIKKLVTLRVWDQLKTPTIASAGMIFFVAITYSSWSKSWINFVSFSVMSGIVYLVMFWLLGRNKFIAEIKSLKN